MRSTPRTQVGDIAEDRVKPGIYHGRLAETYDAISQYVVVALSPSSVSGSYKARVSAGGFGTGQTYPAGTPVTVAVHHGRVEVLSLSGGRKNRLEDSFFRDASDEFSEWHSNFPDSQKRIKFKDFGVVGQDSDYYGTIMSARWPNTFLDLDSSFELHGGSGTISTQPGGGMELTAGGGLTAHSDGGMTLDSDSGMTLAADGSVVINNGTGLFLNSLPTSNPGQAGRIWNDGGTLKIS